MKTVVIIDKDDVATIKSLLHDALIDLSHIEADFYQGQVDRRLNEALEILKED